MRRWLPRPPAWSLLPKAARSSRWGRGAPTSRRPSRRLAPPTWPASPRRRTWPRNTPFGIPSAGTAAHAFTLLHDSEAAAFQAQIDSLGADTTLLVDTYDITAGIATAVEVAGTALGAVRIDSGDLGVLARQAREQLDALGATSTRIVVSGDLDEFAIAALAADPVDSYGAGTSVVTGSGAPTAGLVYKLVEVDGRPVAKRSANKSSQAAASGRCARTSRAAPRSRKSCCRRGRRMDRTRRGPTATTPADARRRPVDDLPDLAASREHLRQALVSLPWDGLKLSRGEPAIPTRLFS